MKKIVLTALLLLMSLSGFHAAQAAPFAKVGQVASDFSLTTLDGNSFKLSEHKGKKPVYLVFWASWCPSCKAEIPAIKAIHKQLKGEMEIVAINVAVNDSLAKVQRYVDRFEIPYAVAFDQESKVTAQYGVQGIPTQIIIDINGVIRYRNTVSPENVAAYLTVKTASAAAAE